MANNDIFSLSSCYLNSSCTADQLTEITNNSASWTDISYVAVSGGAADNTNACITATANKCDAATKLTILNNIRADESTTENNNKSRLLEINTYYGKKRLAQNAVLKTVGIMLISIMILWLIGEYFPIIPSWLLSLSMSMTLAVGSLMIIFKTADMSHRNNMNYDTYDIPTSGNLPQIKSVLSGTQGNISSGSSSSSSIGGKHCSDNSCCPKFYTFNSSLGYCGLNPFVN